MIGARRVAQAGLVGAIIGATLMGLIDAALHPVEPTKCPAPWKMTDKTVLPSAIETILKDHEIKAEGIPMSAMKSKVVLVMSCEPLGIYRVETETNP